MIDVINLQRKIKIDLPSLSQFTRDLTEKVEEAQNKTFSVALIPDKRMRELNNLFRGQGRTTDVLSFPYEPIPGSPPYDGGVDAAAADGVVLSPDESLATHNSSLATFLGDIVISAEQAQKQATENTLTLDLELKQLILHGLLHLLGHDHETDNGEMNSRELDLRKILSI